MRVLFAPHGVALTATRIYSDGMFNSGRLKGRFVASPLVGSAMRMEYTGNRRCERSDLAASKFRASLGVNYKLRQSKRVGSSGRFFDEVDIANTTRSHRDLREAYISRPAGSRSFKLPSRVRMYKRKRAGALSSADFHK